MSDVLGVNYTKFATPTPANIIARGLVGGKLRAITDTYEASALEAGSTIKVGRDLNAGDTILGVLISWDDLGTSVTLSIGDSDDDNRYVSALDVASAAGSNFTILPDGMLYTIGTADGDETILITTAAAAATGTIKVAVIYLVS